MISPGSTFLVDGHKSYGVLLKVSIWYHSCIQWLHYAVNTTVWKIGCIQHNLDETCFLGLDEVQLCTAILIILSLAYLWDRVIYTIYSSPFANGYFLILNSYVLKSPFFHKAQMYPLCPTKRILQVKGVFPGQ